MLNNTSTAGVLNPSNLKYKPATCENGMRSDLPVESPGGVFSSWKYGLGRILTAQNCGSANDDGLNREDFMKTLRGVVCDLSKFDTDIVNGRLVTFDKEFCEAIGGYPAGACLWHVKGDSIELLVSSIPNNDYNFIEDESCIGTKWIRSTRRDTSEGFPVTDANSVVTPFGKVKGGRIVGKANMETHRITELYQAEKDYMLVCNGTISYKYENKTRLPGCEAAGMYGACVGIPSNDNKWVPWISNNITYKTDTSNIGVMNFEDRIVGTIACCGHQFYVAVSDVGDDPIVIKRAYIGSPHDALESAYALGNTIYYRDGFGFPYNAIYNGTNKRTSSGGDFGYETEREFADCVRTSGGEISYYPIFNQDMTPRTLMVPVRAMQTVFVVECPKPGFSVTDYELDIRLFPIK